MKIKDLIDILTKFNPEAEVVIHKDVDEYGYSHLTNIIPGIFKLTDYGGDFFPHQQMIVLRDEVQAICLVAEDQV